MRVLCERPFTANGIRMRCLPLSFSLLCVITACAPNRPADVAAIPAPLVSALIDERGSPTRPAPKFSVGQLPSGYPVELMPAGPTRVVGGMATDDETIVVFADSTRRLAAVLEQVFEQHGYTRPRPRPGSGFSAGSGPYSYFCGDGGTVAVAPLTGANRSFARVTFRPTRANGSCRTFDQPQSYAELALPELKPPAGVHVTGSGSGNNSGGISSNARMTGADLNVATVLAHYAAQLIAAGWTADAPAASHRVAAQYFAARDTSGGAWEGVLMASGGKTVLTMSLDMHRRDSR